MRPIIFRPEDAPPNEDEDAREARRNAVTLLMCPCCSGRGLVSPEHASRCHVDPESTPPGDRAE